MVTIVDLYHLIQKSVIRAKERGMFKSARIYPGNITFEEFKNLREMCQKDGYTIEMSMELGEHDSYQVIDITW